MEENWIVFIPRSSMILQGDKLSLLALPSSTTKSKLKNNCMWGVLLQMMVCVLNGVHPSIYSPTRTVHGGLNLVGGETIICMPPCNRLKKVGPSCRHGGCARTIGGPPWPPPSRGRFVSGPWSFPWFRMDPGVLVCFSIYLWFAPFLNTLSGSALSRDFCAFPRVIPEIDICNKTCGKVSSKPYHLFILFIKMMFTIIR